jgi:hypothetical protein
MDNNTIFATLYILAQGVERLVEPFSVWKLFGDPSTTDGKRKRTIWLWVVSSAIGILACFIFNVDFFSAAKVVGGTTPPPLNIVISGIIVGSGTKPVHDLITSIQGHAKSKK